MEWTMPNLMSGFCERRRRQKDLSADLRVGIATKLKHRFILSVDLIKNPAHNSQRMNLLYVIEMFHY